MLCKLVFAASQGGFLTPQGISTSRAITETMERDSEK